MTRKKVLMLIGSVCLALMLAVPMIVGCAGPAPTPTPTEEEIHILIGGSGPGGAYYPLACGLMTIINEHVPGVKATAIASGGLANFRTMLEGEMFACLWTLTGCGSMYEGPTEYYPEKQTQVRWLAPTHGSYSWFVTLDPEIKTWYDIKGKKLAMGGPGTTDPLDCEMCLRAIGMNKDVDYDGVLLDGFEAAEALIDGRVHAFYSGGGLLTPCITEVDVMKDLHFIRPPEGTQDQILAYHEEGGHKVFFTMVPNELYRGLDEDYEAIVSYEGFVTNKVQPEELVYKVTKALWENVELMALVHTSGAELSLEKVKEMRLRFPCHSGALRYYKEIGVLTEDPFKG